MWKVVATAVLMSVLVSVSVAGRGKWQGRGKWKHRGCGASGAAEESQEGLTFKWTVTGLDNDDLRVTYTEGAFAPEGGSVVHKYPRDRGQRALGVVPAKIFYDFSGPEPLAVIRAGKRGRGVCILVASDVNTYDDLLAAMTDRNMTNTDMPEEEEAVRLRATMTSQDGDLSQNVRDLCSKDKCGRPIDPVYYVTEISEIEAALEEEADPTDMEFEPSFVLFNTRYTISGLPDPRQQRRWQRRQQRRQNRRQNRRDPDRAARRQQRLERRQQRMERRRGGAAQPAV